MNESEWLAKWDELRPIEREFVLAVHPYILELDLTRLKSPRRVRDSIWTQVYKKELIEFPVCERCGGSGSYSFNLTDGTRCYGCNGKGFVLPRLSKKLVAEIKRAADNHPKILEMRAENKREFKRGGE